MSAFKAIKIAEHVYWVGAIDRDIRDFHGYSTSRGTTYNAYLILTEEPILIDTVKAPFYEEMMSRIRSVIEPEKIQYLISNHSEMDHSGSLVKTIAAIKPKKVFASKMGVKALQAHFHWEQSIQEIESGGSLTLGNASFKFLETRMLHWPDSMFTFFENDGVLFSQDAFGMHLATGQLFASKQDKKVLEQEAAKYYANILLPYSPLVLKLLEQLPTYLNIKIIAPDHGPIWETAENIKWILTLWKNWAEQKIYKKAIIVYATMWQSTATMAKAIFEGVQQENVEAKLMPLSTSHRSDVATELLTAGALLVGSPTINQQMFPTVSDVLCYLKGLKRKNLIGQVFGSYGWAGEAIRLLQEELKAMQIEMIGNPIKAQYVPDKNILMECQQLGKLIAVELKKRVIS